MEADWVDFKAIKAAVTIDMVLDRYDVVLKKTGYELRGKCPIHGGSNNKHFTANLNKNVFKCFFAECGAHGNVLDLVASVERCSVREAALKLSDWFKVGESVQQASESDDESSVRPGIYRDHSGRLYEVAGVAMDPEDRDLRVVYRELFGDYRLRIGPLLLVKAKDRSTQPFLALVKSL